MVVRGNIDKDYFADGRPDLVENGVEIDVEAIARALVNIYQERIDIEHDIDDGLYRETLRIIKDAVDNGYADAIEEGTPAPDEEFRDAFEHSAEVFSAFRVHRMQNDIAAQMIDSSGKVKPFREFVRDVSSYIDHQNRAWLQTEYNTAILRAQNAAEWKQFQEEKDVYPNLEWIRSTSPNPGADHVPFWGTVLPVDDPFWDEHKPGDRWNCKCELRQTDKHSTSVPHSDGSSDAARGLESNPAKAREVFSQNHPYYPSSCVSCPFSGNKLIALVQDLAGGKHCHNCKSVNKCIGRAEEIANVTDLLKRLHEVTGKAYVETLHDIISSKEFKPVRRDSRILSAISTKASDYPNLFNAARKLLAIEERVYILPNPSDTRKPDIICQHKGSIRAYDVKTISGRNSVGNRLSESIGQTNRVVLNMTVDYNPRSLYAELKRYFESSPDASEVRILVGKRILSITREMPTIKEFIFEYNKKK